jgi:hypothetical protein
MSATSSEIDQSVQAALGGFYDKSNCIKVTKKNNNGSLFKNATNSSD